jgi:hypothetical protein
VLSITADVVLRPDGTPIGKSIVEAKGPIAVAVRGAMAQAALKGGSEFAKERLSAQNWRGTGTLDPRDPTDHTEPYTVAMSFDLSNHFFGDGPNRNALPLGPQLVNPAYLAPLKFIREKWTQDFPCLSQTYSQAIDVHLPPNHRLAQVPQNVDVSTPMVNYRATYHSDGSLLHVERRFILNLPGQVCTIQTARDVSKAVLAAVKDMSTAIDFGKDETTNQERDSVSAQP